MSKLNSLICDEVAMHLAFDSISIVFPRTSKAPPIKGQQKPNRSDMGPNGPPKWSSFARVYTDWPRSDQQGVGSKYLDLIPCKVKLANGPSGHYLFKISSEHVLDFLNIKCLAPQPSVRKHTRVTICRLHEVVEGQARC